ncbi:MFS transporter [Xenophilus arseniciresistens]|uniref:MFS transporter n=1 Tax=Xenophilus arseniciresistens TaxID=1283306 RepID=A0AAE3N6Q2_9BURK|nr:MFS transporter [Xenophilus arseniciresistens]MDA7416955.1 MFS transporter [Xenophilus arseniciresistens]
MLSTPSAAAGSAGSAAATSPAPPSPADAGIRPGTPESRRAGLAMFLVGFASFSMIYCVQPLLPAFSASFGIGPAASSLALSLTTGFLAVAIVLAGAFSQALGRRGVMAASMLLAALLNLAAAVLPSWHGLLVVRALEGLVLGGVPAVAMAWLAEEIHPAHLGRSMGLYVAGTAFGGMAGRVGMGLMTEFTSWRMAMGLLGVLCLLCAIAFLRLLPPSRHFTPRPGLDLRYHLQTWGAHLRNRGLLRLYAMGFLCMSVFVALFNYATFMLSAPPHALSQTLVSLIFLSYALGMVSSSMAGRLADRLGRRPLLAAGFAMMLCGVLLTLAGSLWLVIAGIAVVTTGFFIAHAVASSAVGPQAGAAKGHAASLYLLFYYLGSSVTGSVGGWFWQHGGWPAVVALTAGLCLTALAMILFLKPLPPARAAA